MDIDPGMLSFYKELLAKTPIGSDQWPLDEQRAAWNQLCKQFRAPRPDGLNVSDLETDGVKFASLFRKVKTQNPAFFIFMAEAGFWVGLKRMMICVQKWQRGLIAPWPWWIIA